MVYDTIEFIFKKLCNSIFFFRMDVKTIEEDKSGTDPEDEVPFDIPNVTDYRDAFQPTRSRKLLQIERNL